MTRSPYSGTITLVTYWHSHEPPDDYWAFESRDAAECWLESRGVDMSEAETYTSPGGEHDSVEDPEKDRMHYSIRELEVQSDG